MKYYDEDVSGNLRLQLENEVMDWPHVSTKKNVRLSLLHGEKEYICLLSNQWNCYHSIKSR